MKKKQNSQKKERYGPHFDFTNTKSRKKKRERRGGPYYEGPKENKGEKATGYLPGVGGTNYFIKGASKVTRGGWALSGGRGEEKGGKGQQKDHVS